jgi:rhomboid protease GluP
MVPEEHVYRPRRGRAWRAGLLLILASGLLAKSQRASSLSWSSGIAVAFACLGLLLGIWKIATILRGYPRLLVSPAGIRLQSGIRTRWADWNSLTAFQLQITHVGFNKRPLMSATAGIIGPKASRRLLRRKRFEIPDIFVTQIATIANEINANYLQVVETVAPSDQRIGVADFKLPWMAIVINGVLITVFVTELTFAFEPLGPGLHLGLATLLGLGSLNRFTVVSNGEWYRILTASLLHSSINHLIANGIALLIAGFILERLVGRLWFLALFVSGSIGGSLLILVFSPTLTSLGSSGAVCGLFAATYACSFRSQNITERSRVRTQGLCWLILTMLPIVTSTTTEQINHSGHIGGALAGAAVGFLLLKNWPDTSALPTLRGFAYGISIAGALLSIAGFAAVASHYRQYEVVTELIPGDQLPKGTPEIVARAADLLARYPHDPRSHMSQSVSLLMARDLSGAEQELRIALRQTQALNYIFGPQFEHTIQGGLALVQFEGGQLSQSRETAQIACSGPGAVQPAPDIRTQLVARHLCD